MAKCDLKEESYIVLWGHVQFYSLSCCDFFEIFC